jgi:hypothetical protein
MQFNDTTTKNGLIQDCEFLTGLGYTQISGDSARLAEFTRLINQRYHWAVSLILRSQDGWDYDDVNHVDYPILTTNLTNGTQVYDLSILAERLVSLKRVEITYDGTNWYKAEPFDVGETGSATDSTSIAASFSKMKPYYDVQYNALWLYPIPDADVTSGLKIWISRDVDEFASTDTTQEPGIDRGFHRIISLAASYDWVVAQGLSIAPNLLNDLMRYEEALRSHYGKKERDRKFQMVSGYINYE